MARLSRRGWSSFFVLAVSTLISKSGKMTAAASFWRSRPSSMMCQAITKLIAIVRLSLSGVCEGSLDLALLLHLSRLKKLIAKVQQYFWVLGSSGELLV